MADTWEYDGAAGAWTHVQDIGPEACFNSALVFKTARCEMFGGASALGNAAPPPKIFDFSWEWDGAHWTARQDIGPGPRVGHAMAYDSARDRVVLFGGAATPLDDPAGNTAPLSDTWEQFETGASAGAGSAPEVPLADFTIFPASAPGGPGYDITFAVELTGPAGAAGQDVPITMGGGAALDVAVPAGVTIGQTVVPATMIPMGNYVFDATAGGVTKSAPLSIY
jgi:hypothetical protein